jgi:hypothetical protein
MEAGLESMVRAVFRIIKSPIFIEHMMNITCYQNLI